jgi:diadenylate cyclase
VIEWLWDSLLELWAYVHTNYDPWRDTVDILAVTLGIYWLLLLIRGTRAGQILVGLLVLFTANFASETFGLVTLRSILATFMQSAIIIIVILFQHDLRRALARVGRGFFPNVSAQQESQMLEEVVRAAQILAQKRLGALIVLERETGLDDQIEGGQAVDAAVTKELLVSLFVPYAPLHDGAVVIQRGRVALAGAILPLTLKTDLPEGVGTRHRAAVGITEETDAVVVVVSEETRTISLVMGGEMVRDLDAPRLRELLREILGGERRDLLQVGEESAPAEPAPAPAAEPEASSGARTAG